MWKLYVTGLEGVAITSTYDRLARSFPKSHRTKRVRNEDGTDRHLFIKLGVVKSSTSRATAERWQSRFSISAAASSTSGN
jgi:hypothetical protein